MKSALNEKWIVCRICLRQPHQETMQTIFDANDARDLTHMIQECGGVPIHKYDHYPDKICEKCCKYLHIAFKFRQTCQRSYKHLSRFIAPVEVTIETKIDTEVAAESDLNVDLELVTEGEEDEETDLKLEPLDSKLDIKSELDESDDADVVAIYEPMETIDYLEDVDVTNLEPPSTSQTQVSDIEYLSDADPEFIDEPLTSDEEFVPNVINKPRKTRGRPPSKGNRRATGRAAANSSRDSAQQKRRHRSICSKNSKGKKNKETSFICDICGNIYPSQGRLTEHIKLHKGIKPHECEICGHAFAQTQQLARHMNTHTGNRPYKCQYCPAAFADLSTRNKHHRIHTNERPYVCDVCGKSFTYTNTLKFHKMIHTGEKPFVCEICGKGFQQAYKLRNHKNTHEKKLMKVEKLEVESLHSYQEVSLSGSTHILEIHE